MAQETQKKIRQLDNILTISHAKRNHALPRHGTGQDAGSMQGGSEEDENAA
jgi:hypothetical protein